MTNSVKRESIWALYNQERHRKNNYHFSIEDITEYSSQSEPVRPLVRAT